MLNYLKKKNSYLKKIFFHEFSVHLKVGQTQLYNANKQITSQSNPHCKWGVWIFVPDFFQAQNFESTI